METNANTPLKLKVLSWKIPQISDYFDLFVSLTSVISESAILSLYIICVWTFFKKYIAIIMTFIVIENLLNENYNITQIQCFLYVKNDRNQLWLLHNNEKKHKKCHFLANKISNSIVSSIIFFKAKQY